MLVAVEDLSETFKHSANLINTQDLSHLVALMDHMMSLNSQHFIYLNLGLFNRIILSRIHESV